MRRTASATTPISRLSTLPPWIRAGRQPSRYPYYHSADDTPDKLTYVDLGRITDGLIGCFTEIAVPALSIAQFRVYCFAASLTRFAQSRTDHGVKHARCG